MMKPRSKLHTIQATFDANDGGCTTSATGSVRSLRACQMLSWGMREVCWTSLAAVVVDPMKARGVAYSRPFRQPTNTP
jgi:hypothetical protein